MSTNTLPLQQEDNYLEEENNVNIDNASKPNIPESHEQDSSLHHINSSECLIQPQDELAMMPEEEEQQQPDPADQDTLVFDSEESDEEPSTLLLTPPQVTQPSQWVNQLQQPASPI